MVQQRVTLNLYAYIYVLTNFLCLLQSLLLFRTGMKQDVLPQAFIGLHTKKHTSKLMNTTIHLIISILYNKMKPFTNGEPLNSDLDH